MCWQDQLLNMKLVAAFCALLTSLLFCFNNLLIQHYKLHCTDLLIVRSGVQVLLFGVLLKIQQKWTLTQKWTKKDYILLILQAVTNILTMVLCWLSLSLLPIGDAIALIYTFPIFSILLSYICFGDKPGLYQVMVTLLSIFGAILIVEPTTFSNTETTVASSSDSDHQYVLGTIVSLAAACIGAANNLTVFQLHKIHPYILLLTSGILGLILALIICPLDEQNQIFHQYDQVNLQMLFGSSILGILGLFLNTYSCQHLNPVVFSVLRCQEVVFSFGIQYVSSEMNAPTFGSILGTAMVVFSSLLVPLEQYFFSKIGNKLKHQ